MKTFFFTVILLFWAGSFLSCSLSEPNTTVYDDEEEISPCDPPYSVPPYPDHPTITNGILPWVYEVIDDWLEKGTHGTITRCEYRDGIGYLFEPLENKKDFGYSFRSCDGTVLYEGEENPIDDTYPELNIKRKLFLLGQYPSWVQEETPSDEFLCYFINPFTLPRVKEMLYRCPVPLCRKMVIICKYRDGVGFLLGEHIRSSQQHWELLDCNGNLLCESEGAGLQLVCPELNVKFYAEDVVIETVISFNVDPH